MRVKVLFKKRPRTLWLLCNSYPGIQYQCLGAHGFSDCNSHTDLYAPLFVFDV